MLLLDNRNQNQNQYQVSQMQLSDQKLDYVDFLRKFAQWNSDCVTLKLSKVDIQNVHD